MEKKGTFGFQQLRSNSQFKMIGVFKRLYFDHKYEVVEATREIDDILAFLETEREIAI